MQSRETALERKVKGEVWEVGAPVSVIRTNGDPHKPRKERRGWQCIVDGSCYEADRRALVCMSASFGPSRVLDAKAMHMLMMFIVF